MDWIESCPNLNKLPVIRRPGNVTGKQPELEKWSLWFKLKPPAWEFKVAAMAARQAAGRSLTFKFQVATVLMVTVVVRRDHKCYCDNALWLWLEIGQSPSSLSVHSHIVAWVLFILPRRASASHEVTTRELPRSESLTHRDWHQLEWFHVDANHLVSTQRDFTFWVTTWTVGYTGSCHGDVLHNIHFFNVQHLKRKM